MFLSPDFRVGLEKAHVLHLSMEHSQLSNVLWFFCPNIVFPASFYQKSAEFVEFFESDFTILIAHRVS